MNYDVGPWCKIGVERGWSEQASYLYSHKPLTCSPLTVRTLPYEYLVKHGGGTR